MDEPYEIDNGIPGVAGLGNDVPVSQYLVRRERELIQQTAALRGALLPKEQELASVRKAMEAIGVTPSYTEQLTPFLDQNQDRRPHAGFANTVDAAALQSLQTIAASLTIKDMILRALRDHFRDGATPSELSEYMRVAYRRDIDRNSISPQLARLREEGLVQQNANALLSNGGKWELTVRGDLTNALTEVEKRNVNALAPSPRGQRWYGGGKPEKKD